MKEKENGRQIRRQASKGSAAYSIVYDFVCGSCGSPGIRNTGRINDKKDGKESLWVPVEIYLDTGYNWCSGTRMAEVSAVSITSKYQQGTD